MNKITILKPQEFCEEVGISRATLVRYLKQFPDFPRLKIEGKGGTSRFVKEIAVPYYNRKKKEDCVVSGFENHPSPLLVVDTKRFIDYYV